METGGEMKRLKVAAKVKVHHTYFVTKSGTIKMNSTLPVQCSSVRCTYYSTYHLHQD